MYDSANISFVNCFIYKTRMTPSTRYETVKKKDRQRVLNIQEIIKKNKEACHIKKLREDFVMYKKLVILSKH